ncbi:MAG: CDP-alcohol phosphatidyltransferase family protein [Candidatus Aminicenantes bacterium]|nr:CDP-alcohol phosphatidyltransferase family protein [Candidatus Aminicenantes bacterium]
MNDKQKNLRLLPKPLLLFVHKLIERTVVLFIKLKFSPNTLTVLALLLGLGSGVFFGMEHPIWAAGLLILCGIFDILDGMVAVKTMRTTVFGAIFDSTLDRYSEFFVYLGLAYYFRNHWAIWVLFFTFLGSTMVSYTRARAEGLGIECKVGIMQRAERIVLVSLGAIIGPLLDIYVPVIIGILIFIALISNIAAFQRVFHVKKVEKQRNKTA